MYISVLLSRKLFLLEMFYGYISSTDYSQVSIAKINNKVLRILTSMFAIGIMDNEQTGNITYVFLTIFF